MDESLHTSAATEVNPRRACAAGRRRVEDPARGVFLAIMISESVLGLASVAVFRMGRWKTKKV